MIVNKNFNPHLSVDCVIFGFNGESLKVLLIEQNTIPSNSNRPNKYKLPGDLIILMEDLEDAARRVLYELTGLENIFLKQFAVFGNLDRMSNENDRKWLEETSGVAISRVVTTSYYSLIRIDKSKSTRAQTHNASWHDINNLPKLAFDHKNIIKKGIASLRKEIRFDPICFELLPRKFTIRQIQKLYESIIGLKLDNRNFRKKLLKAPYIEVSDQKEKGVAHKPAYFYRFSKAKYLAQRSEQLYYNF